MYKTAEAVSPAHPDKLCDQISDIILDFTLDLDPDARVAIEVCGWHNRIFITWEVTTKEKILDDEYKELVEAVLMDNRYHPNDYSIEINISKQSPNIAQWVDTGGAWDQGIMVWYATRETLQMIPYELVVARNILRHLWDNNKNTRDAKAQVTTKNGLIDTIVVSAERVTAGEIHDALNVMFYSNLEGVTLHLNPAWEWWNGGFEADAWVTGRKLAVDNYWPQIEIGWWAFSWKDCTKVDRSWAYMARKLAVRYLNEHPKIDWVKFKIAYSIWVAEPVMVSCETNKWFTPVDKKYTEWLTPKEIAETLELKDWGFYQTAKWGHFWNNFIWDKVE